MVSFLSVFKLTIPVLMGYISVGMAFGLLAEQLGIPWYFSLLMSFIVYAGSGQFLAITLFSAKVGFFEIAIATFLLNLRHSFYGLSMIRAFKKMGLIKAYLIFGLTDETFALLQTMPYLKKLRQRRYAYFFITFLNQIYWIIGTLLGALIGNSININYKGIEFALTALFVVLAIQLYKKYPNKKILLLSILVGFFGIFFLPSSQMLVISLSCCIVLILGLQNWISQ